MITSQLISFKDSFIGNTMNAAQSISEVLASTHLLTVIATITAIAFVVFGSYKLAIHLGYFSPKGLSENQDLSRNRYTMPTAPTCEQDLLEHSFVPPASPQPKLVLSESSPQMQEEIFNRLYPNFGHSS